MKEPMLNAFDTLLQIAVSANAAAANSDNEAFRYECLCCGEEVFLAAQDSVYQATHFRHRSGNNDKDCELYLGKYGIVPSTPSFRNKRQDRVEFYYNNTHKVFYMSFKFSDEEISAYETANSCIEVRSSRTQQPFFTKKINHINFCNDIRETYVLDTYASPYYISNTSNNIKREYNLFDETSPTFFKIQGEGLDYTAKYIKSNSLYTNVKYLIVWPGCNSAQIRLNNVPGVIIYDRFEFVTMNNTRVWALVATFVDKNPQLDALVQLWGYNISASEELTLLWPPACKDDETLYVTNNSIYVLSSFALAPGNTNVHSSFIHPVDTNVTRIDIKDNLIIIKKNAEMLVKTTAFLSEIVPLDLQHITTTKFVVPNKGLFYCYSSRGAEKLSPGQTVFLTETMFVVEYCGNYKLKVITLQEDIEPSLSEKIRDALSYYWVSTPYSNTVDEHCSDDALEYLHKSKTQGYINQAVLRLIEEDGKSE